MHLPRIAHSSHPTCHRIVSEPLGFPVVFAQVIAAWAFFVRPAGRTYLEVKVLYTPGKGKC